MTKILEVIGELVIFLLVASVPLAIGVLWIEFLITFLVESGAFH